MQCYFTKLSRLKKVHTLPVLQYSVITDMIKQKSTDVNTLIDPRVKNIKDKLLYSDYIEKKSLKLGYGKNKSVQSKLNYRFEKEKQLIDLQTSETSVALKYLRTEHNHLTEPSDNYRIDQQEKSVKRPIHMPYATIDEYKEVSTKSFQHEDKHFSSSINEKYRNLYEKYLELSKYTVTNPKSNANGKVIDHNLTVRLQDDFSNVSPHWMTDYEIFNDALQENIEDFQYGTPDPDSEISSIPCGGCGALLHCKDVAIPGYLPSELFKNKMDEDLQDVTCQRCHFMKNYNTCLDVRVSSDEYPNLIKKINDNTKAVILLLVDLTDFPCSIWPELPTIIGETRRVFIVGNKVDLLPIDSAHFLSNVKDCLTESLIQSGISTVNIKHISLISAKTGFGVDSLINKLHKIQQYQGDIYLIGCTNAGKSTLFNTLLQSDLCKSQAVDLIQRATTSPWPGTTLNLLKFPILNPTKARLAMRAQRLRQQQKDDHAQMYLKMQEFKMKKNIELTTLQSRISHTFKKMYEINNAAHNSNNSDIITINTIKKFGIDETDDDYKNSHWCFDTPGVIQPDQILHFLTTDELLKTMPRKIISPRTFCIWPGQSIFIAGLGRLDILDAPSYIRCTVFASIKLPITMCEVKNAEVVYNELLPTEALVVPTNNPNRLKMWPKLKSKDLETVGIGTNESVSDVVLSNAGWIAITARENMSVTMRAWTPEGRGIHLRTPSLLPNSVTHRGMRRVGTPAYRLGKQVYFSKKV